LALAVVVAVAAGAWMASIAWGRRPESGPVRYTITMDEYRFAPAAVTWPAGETVTLTVVNDSGATPGKAHEIMFGTDPWVEQGPFGPLQGDGFLNDFLAGSLQIDAAHGVSMLMLRQLELTGNADALLVPAMGGMGDTPGLSGMEAGNASGAAGMGAMDMADGDADMADGSDMAGGGDMAGDGMAGMEVDMYLSKDLEGQVEPEMEDMRGNFMLVLEPGGSFTMTFQVPEEPGTFAFGCFQETGEHFLNGMRGTITVRPRTGASL